MKFSFRTKSRDLPAQFYLGFPQIVTYISLKRRKEWKKERADSSYYRLTKNRRYQRFLGMQNWSLVRTVLASWNGISTVCDAKGVREQRWTKGSFFLLIKDVILQLCTYIVKAASRILKTILFSPNLNRCRAGTIQSAHVFSFFFLPR